MFVLIMSGTAFAEDNITKNDIKINFTTIYSGSTHYQLMGDAVKQYPNVNYTTYLTTQLPTNLDLSNQNLIMLDLYQDSYVPSVQSTIDEAKKKNATVIILSPQSDLAKNLSSIDITQYPYIMQYFDNGGYENEKDRKSVV